MTFLVSWNCDCNGDSCNSNCIETTSMHPQQPSTMSSTTTEQPSTMSSTTEQPSTMSSTTTEQPSTMSSTTEQPSTMSSTTTEQPSTMSSTTTERTTSNSTPQTTMATNLCSTHPCYHGNCSIYQDTYICTCDSGYYGSHCDHRCEHLEYITDSYPVGNQSMQHIEYAPVHHHTTYSDALEYCEARCGQLMKILTPAKFDFIQHTLEKFQDYDHSYWIDGKADSYHTWKTSTGEVLPMSSDMWAYNRPHTTDYKCATLEKTQQHHFYDHDCANHKYNVLCEKAITPTSPSKLPPTTTMMSPTTTMTSLTTTMNPDPCHSNPCAHGGTCTVQGNNHYSCKCHSNYYGDRCTQVCHPPPWTTKNYDYHQSVTLVASMHHMTFSEGKKFCQENCGQLIQILTPAKLQTITEYLIHEDIAHTYWIDGERESQHVWKTSAGDHISVTPALWALDPSTRIYENCAAFEDDANFKLVNFECGSDLRVLCEKL